MRFLFCFSDFYFVLVVWAFSSAMYSVLLVNPDNPCEAGVFLPVAFVVVAGRLPLV